MPASRHGIAVMVAVAVSVMSSVTTWFLTRPPERTPPREAFSLLLPPTHDVVEFAISPDGTILVYAAVVPPNQDDGDAVHEEDSRSEIRLFVRRIDDFDAKPLPGTENAQQPFFSPDGTRVGFFADGVLKWTTVDGAVPVEVIETSARTAGASWADDDRIVFATLDGGGLQVVSAPQETSSSPAARVVTRLTTPNHEDGETTHGWPHLLLDGRTIIFTVARADRDPRLALLTPESDDYALLSPSDGGASYVRATEEQGWLVFARRGEIMVRRIDFGDREPAGPIQAIAAGVAGSAAGYDRLGRSSLAVARATGRIVFAPSGEGPAHTVLAWVDRQGRSSDIDGLPARHEAPRVAPDGSRIVMAVRQGPFSRDLWEYSVSTGGRRQLTADAGDNHSPVWSSSGERITFASNRDGPQQIYQLPVGGAHTPGLLLSGDARTPGSWTEDGRSLLFHEVSAEGNRDIWISNLQPDAVESTTLLLGSSANERAPAMSPDGRWLAYVSDASDGDQVYLRTYPTGPEWRVSMSGGSEPVWAKDGSELFFRRGRHVFAIDVTNMHEPDPAPPPAHRLFSGSFLSDPGGNVASYDVSPDGRRFIMLRPTERTTALSVLTGWEPTRP